MPVLGSVGSASAATTAATPAGTLAGDTVEEQLYELDTEKATPAQIATALAAVPVDGSAATPSLRTLGSGALQAAAGTAPGDLAYQLAFGAGPTGVIKPWHVPVTFGPELWELANFRTGIPNGNSTSLTPSITPNGTLQTLRTLVSIGVLQADMCFRLTGRVVSMPSVGWAYIQVKLVDSAADDIAGTVPQTLFTNGLSHLNERFEFDFRPGNLAGVGAFIEVQLQVYNNATLGSGLLAIDSMSLKEATNHSRPMFYTGPSAHVSRPNIHQQVFNPVTGIWHNVRTNLDQDGALDVALASVTHYDGPRPWRYPPADPLFAGATAPATDSVGSNEELAANALARFARVGNNDQIIEVLKQDGTTWELRCNVHGGETLITSASPNLIYEVDHGDGAWVVWDGLGGSLKTCRRFRFTFNTQIARSAPDSDVIATTTHVATFFPDGMMRMDRTTTFAKTVTVRLLFDWMSSHDINTPKIGRIGSGHTTTDAVDIYTKASRPAAPTAGTSTSGGTLAAATYTYGYTDLTEGGETTLSPVVTQVTTGSTSTVTLTLPAVPAGVTGRRIYGRATGTMRQVLMATLGPVTTWTDDGTLPAFGQQPPKVNTARRLDQPTSIDLDSALSDSATWAVWRDLPTGLCFANIFDRDSLLSRNGVAAARSKLEAGGGIVKNYILAVWSAGESSSIPSGTVWTATHWCMSYAPADPDGRWEQEIADRAAFLSSLKTLYPAT